MNQPDLFSTAPPPPDSMQADQSKLSARLAVCGWQTRSQLAEHFGWTERHIRDLAESLGSDITRSQAGFKLTKDLTRDDLPLAQQAADAFLSQGKRMIRYSIGLKRKLHGMIG